AQIDFSTNALHVRGFIRTLHIASGLHKFIKHGEVWLHLRLIEVLKKKLPDLLSLLSGYFVLAGYNSKKSEKGFENFFTHKEADYSLKIAKNCSYDKKIGPCLRPHFYANEFNELFHNRLAHFSHNCRNGFQVFIAKHQISAVVLNLIFNV